jgi:uncharacterized protein (DUF1778 family)
MSSPTTRSAPRPSSSARKEARLFLRTDAQQEDLIKRAAEAQGKTVTSFVLDSATSKARDVLSERQVYALDRPTWERFVKALDRPAKRRPRLAALLKSTKTERRG